jgi:hypothetical protein
MPDIVSGLEGDPRANRISGEAFATPVLDTRAGGWE